MAGARVRRMRLALCVGRVECDVSGMGAPTIVCAAAGGVGLHRCTADTNVIRRRGDPGPNTNGLKSLAPVMMPTLANYVYGAAPRTPWVDLRALMQQALQPARCRTTVRKVVVTALSPSRGSNADANATTFSPTTTANGSLPLDFLAAIGASTHAIQAGVWWHALEPLPQPRDFLGMHGHPRTAPSADCKSVDTSAPDRVDAGNPRCAKSVPRRADTARQSLDHTDTE